MKKINNKKNIKIIPDFEKILNKKIRKFVIKN